MSYELRELLEKIAAAVIFLAVMAIIIGGALWVGSLQCEAAWKQSGLATDWGPIQGCLVQRKDGTWVPSRTIREMSP